MVSIRMGTNLAGNQQKHLSLSCKFISRGTYKLYSDIFSNAMNVAIAKPPQNKSLFNPSGDKCGQRQNSTIIRKYFILQNFDKEITPCERTGRDVLFEWSLRRILTTDNINRLLPQTQKLDTNITHKGLTKLHHSLW